MPQSKHTLHWLLQVDVYNTCVTAHEIYSKNIFSYHEISLFLPKYNHPSVPRLMKFIIELDRCRIALITDLKMAKENNLDVVLVYHQGQVKGKTLPKCL